ncbi:MAG: GAF domain-containing protein [Chloroflexi bacterium]|nr:GAF domain-containing protein [Chloroflexota bacterium]
MQILTAPLRRAFANMPLAYKMISGVLSLLIPAVLITVITLLTVLQVSLTNQLGTNMQGLSHSTANNVANHVASEIARLQLLARNQTIINNVQGINISYGGSESFAVEQIQKLDAKWIVAAQDDPLLALGQRVTSAAELRQFAKADPNNFDLITTDRYGGVVAHTTPPARFDFILEPWRMAAYNDGKGAVYIGPAIYDAATGFYLTLAVPIFAPDSAEVIGTLHTRYRLTTIVNQMGQASGTINLNLVNADGTRLDAPSGGIQIPLEERSYLSQDTWRSGNFGSVPSLIAYSSVRFSPGLYDELRLPWTVIARQDLDRSLAPVQSTVLLVIVFAVIGLVVAILFTFFVANELVRPLAELTQLATEAQDSRRKFSAPVHGHDEIGRLAETFNVLMERVQESRKFLEERVADRTKALAASAEVSRHLSTILDQFELVTQVVQQVQSAFNYYHAHIYLFDEARENLILVGGTGEAGETMLNNGHKITRGRGLVGRAAEFNIPVLVPDVSRESQWLPNPLLPDTKAEAAVPIAVADRVLGVLDIQHNVRNGLTQDDVDLLLSIANQTAIALQNTRALTQAQRQADYENLINAITQKIRATTTVEDAMQVAVRELGRATMAPRTTVRLNVENN